MALKRMVLEIGMGTDIRGADSTKAAVRALRDALWRNSLSIADALGMPREAMRIEVIIGVPRPQTVDKAAVLAVLPYGEGTVRVVEGGLEIPNDAGTDATMIARRGGRPARCGVTETKQMKRVILELGAGTALHGGQYTKAAVRAAQDALHHSSLSFLKALKIDPKSMQVDVTIGVQQPDKVDVEAVKAAFPHGRIAVKVVKGGLDVVDEENDDVTAIASAAIAVRVDVPGQGKA